MPDDKPLDPSSYMARILSGESIKSVIHSVGAYPHVPYVDHAARAIEEHTEAGLAKTMHESIIEVVREFETNLADDEEVGAMLASFGQQVTISVISLGYRYPHLMVFKGIAPDGKAVDLLQHTSQVNLMLVRVKVSDRKPHRVGFEVVPVDDKPSR